MLRSWFLELRDQALCTHLTEAREEPGSLHVVSIRAGQLDESSQGRSSSESHARRTPVGGAARSRFAPLSLTVAALLGLALILGSGPLSAQIQATVPGGSVDVYNPVGDVHVRPSQEVSTRVRIELYPSGGLLERRRLRLLARFGVAAAVFPTTEFHRGADTLPAVLPITADWRFGEGLQFADTLRFSGVGSTVSAELRVALPLNQCVTAHLFFGSLMVDGVRGTFSTTGRIESRTILNRGGRLEVLEPEDRKHLCPG